MSLKTFVKVSNISSLSDARYCSGMMVDVLGFNLDVDSENYVSEKDFKEISEWVSGPKFCGEFSKASKDKICEVLKNCDLDYLQIEELDAVETINLLGKPIIFKFNINSTSDIEKLKSTFTYLDELVEMMVLKCEDENLFEELDTVISFFNGNLRLIKGYGTSNNDHLEKFPGIELEATKEEKPGFKDYGEVMDILEKLELED